jgi:ABC-type amino acid transport substrate-binding protein
MLLNQEEKFQLIFNKLQEKQTEQSMFNQFLAKYPDEWKQLKITFSKFNRSKQFGKTIPLPKPEQSLRKEIRTWLKNNHQ